MKKLSGRTTKSRLLALAKFLRELPPARFNYGSWVGDDWQGKHDLSCGTTACALGWAATMPRFRKLGVRLAYDRTGGAFPDNHVYRLRHRDKRQLGVYQLFGLDDDEGEYLFASDLGLPAGVRFGDASPRHIADKIERFVKSKYGAK